MHSLRSSRNSLSWYERETSAGFVEMSFSYWRYTGRLKSDVTPARLQGCCKASTRAHAGHIALAMVDRIRESCHNPPVVPTHACLRKTSSWWMQPRSDANCWSSPCGSRVEAERRCSTTLCSGASARCPPVGLYGHVLLGWCVCRCAALPPSRPGKLEPSAEAQDGSQDTWLIRLCILTFLLV